MTYLRNAWYVAAWSADLEADKPLAVSILGEPIVLWRAGDRVIALEDRCVHRLAPLSLGRCEGAKLRCMYHGFLYDTEGRVTEIPGQSVIPPQARVKRYAVTEKHSWIWVWMGAADTQDQSLIPPAIGLDAPEWILGHGQLDYAADAQLINDNLLEFSHLTYVHAESFGAGPLFAEERPQLESLPRGVRFERWIVDSQGPVGRRSDALVDNWMTYDFLVPGVLLMWSGSFPAGAAKACDFKKPDYAKAVAGVTFTSQAVTPTGNQTARYFFSWGPHRQFGDEKLRDLLMQVAAKAFGEDKRMIEAQQQIINRTQNPQVLPTAHDRSITLFTKLVARLAREESAAAGSAHHSKAAESSASDMTV